LIDNQSVDLHLKREQKEKLQVIQWYEAREKERKRDNTMRLLRNVKRYKVVTVC